MSAYPPTVAKKRISYRVREGRPKADVATFMCGINHPRCAARRVLLLLIPAAKEFAIRPVRWSHQILRRGRMNRILITGAAGKIGSTLREGLRGRYAVLRLSDIARLDPARAGEEIVRADLADLA